MPGGSAAQADIAILGAGPVGCALALALQGSGLDVVLVAAAQRVAAAAPLRPLALSYASRLLLERIGAWDGLDATPIEQIHVSQAGGFGRTRLLREELGLPALGYVADYGRIAAHLASRISASMLADPEPEPPRARLVVHAEGSSRGQTAGKDYGHSAVVAEVESERRPHGVAWERFTAEGPLALLPMARGYGMVWSRGTAAAAAIMALGEREFLQALQEAFGNRAGRFISAGPRSATPLFLRYRKGGSAAGEVHIGNAAQSLHPVAGQGLNLGLRDAWELAARVRGSTREKLESAEFAAGFARARRVDAQATIRATDLMATLYVRRDPLAGALRGMALTALDVFPPARKFFARRMIFGASAW